MVRTTPFFIIGNWKSNKTVESAVQWFQDMQTLWRKEPLDVSGVIIILCPSTLHLTTLTSLVKLFTLPLQFGAQDISPNLSLKAIALGTFQHEHKCNSCGYEGIFPEIEKVKKK